MRIKQMQKKVKADNRMKKENLQHVFIIGCKGIPAAYGGFETFVDKLTEYQTNPDIQYHVACAAKPEDYDRAHACFTYHRAKCVTFPWRKLGAARAVMYDLDALRCFVRYAEKRQLRHPVFYILACRIGPFIKPFCSRIHALGGQLYVNPDGHEFLRAKWNAVIRRYWKYSEKLMARQADLLVCDSRNIEKYMHSEYAEYRLRTTYIAYGAETRPSRLSDDDSRLQEWYQANHVQAKGYYLVVGRFVPENNYETMLGEFMRSKTDRALVLITDTAGRFFEELKKKTGFGRDPRIRFAGTVYDQELLKKIRENAYAYLHGHEVGGTNPSLLEALACTDLNLLLDVGFNRETAQEGACYWTKAEGSLASCIDQADSMSVEEAAVLGRRAHERIVKYYSWEYITKKYEEAFLTL